MAAVPLDIVAEVVGADPARPMRSRRSGQTECAPTPGQVRSITLMPPDPPAVPEAVQAVLDADWVVFGPGSWFTSVLPHLLVPDLAAALHVTTARRLVVLNLAPQPGRRRVSRRTSTWKSSPGTLRRLLWMWCSQTPRPRVRVTWPIWSRRLACSAPGW